MCDFTDFVTFSNARNDTCLVTRCAIFSNFVTFSNARNDTCFVKQTFWGSIHYFYKKSVFKQTFWGSIHYFSGKSLVKQKKSI